MSAPLDRRIVVVATNASTRAGGEAMLPWQYFRLLHERGHDVHLVTHERNRTNLLDAAPDAAGRLHFTRDRRLSRILERAGRRLPRPVKAMTIWLLMSALGAADLRRTARDLVRAAPHGAVVHEPVPVSPRQPSFMRDVAAPVVVGPLNGNMTYPPAFTQDVRRSEKALRTALRAISDITNRIFDGKGKAATILVANNRTRAALPSAVADNRVQLMVENGVDLKTFQPRPPRDTSTGRFIFIGRLVDWKRVDLLLEAVAAGPKHHTLDIAGTGPMLASLRHRAAELDLEHRVTFHGFVDHDRCAELLTDADALVLPSVYECGGAVVLEAMAVAVPVIATNWGGPADYVLPEVTGILVDPTTPEALVQSLAAAMERISTSADEANEMGAAGRERVEQVFDWQRKIDQIIDVYDHARR